MENQNKRRVSVIQDTEGNNIVVVNDIIFKGRRAIDWEEVEKYLRRYAGEFYRIADTEDVIYIGAELPDEYAHSNYTKMLKGTNAKAKANLVQGIPELIENANNMKHTENAKARHRNKARYGWYKYEARFALPVFDEDEEISRYNVFHAALIIRHANNGRKYLYDVINIKKETSKPFESNDPTK